MSTHTTIDSLRLAHIDRLTVRSQNFHARRIVNAADGVAPQDYVTLSQLKNTLNEAKAFTKTTFGSAKAVSPALVGFAWGENIMSIVSSAVTPDLSLGVFQVVLLNVGTNVFFNAPINAAGVGQPLNLIIIQDATGSHTISFDTTAYEGYQVIIPSGKGNTYTSCSWYLSSSGKWTFCQFHTGIPVT